MYYLFMWTKSEKKKKENHFWEKHSRHETHRTDGATYLEAVRSSISCWCCVSAGGTFVLAFLSVDDSSSPLHDASISDSGTLVFKLTSTICDKMVRSAQGNVSELAFLSWTRATWIVGSIPWSDSNSVCRATVETISCLGRPSASRNRLIHKHVHELLVGVTTLSLTGI